MSFSMAYKHNVKKIKIFHILLFFAARSVVLPSSAYGIKIKCSNIDDYYFTSPGNQCSQYYRCTSKGHYEDRECSDGQKFDFYQQSCGPTPGSCPEPSCNGRSNGIYQDISHACMRSFTCYSGQLTSVDNCPSKHLHNGEKCVPQDQVTCIQSAQSSSYTEDRRCANRLIDGLYPSGTNCNEYIICTGGVVSDIRNCPNEYAFDSTTQECRPQYFVSNCPRDKAETAMEEQLCRDRVDGPVLDATSKDCSTYIMCKSGKYDGHRQCSDQAVFNGENCVPSPLHQCSITKRQVANDQCHRKLNGYYANPQHGCTSYTRCMSERMIEVGICPAGQYFDAEFGKCIHERNLERRRCIERGVSTDCNGRMGYYADAKCDVYFYCHSGSKIEYKCFPGKVFNGKACVPKSQHKCPRIEIDNFCDARFDGEYYKDPNDGCRAYSYCSNGHKITYLCEPGHIFDSRSKKCVRKEILVGANSCHSDRSCYGKSDGYHIDLQSNCRSYIYCINYEKITQITCRDGKVFNGQQCVSPNEYACPSLLNHQQINCVPRHCLRRCESMNGFYADLNSGCRDFYICINGKSSKSSCQAGMRFNGEICISEDKVMCPIVCTHRRSGGSRDGECPLIGYIA